MHGATHRSGARWRIIGGMLALAALALMAWPGLADGIAQAQFTRSFRFEDCKWAAHGRENPYFIPLRPGYRLLFEGEEEDEGETLDKRLWITVTRTTERISFVPPGGERITLRARVIEEREWEDGELIEVSRNWFARCVETGDIYYFGEDVDIYEDGEIVSHDGAWRAGVDGAVPGLIMPATFLLGSRYFQEIAPGVAEDRARHVAMGLEIGDFTDCVAVLETSRLDAGAESMKFYCPGVGLVIDDVLELVEYGIVSAGAE